MGNPDGCKKANSKPDDTMRSSRQWLKQFLWVLSSWWLAAIVALDPADSRAAAEPPDTPKAPIRSGCEYDYAPFCLVRDGQADGFSVALLREVLRAIGRDVTFKTAPWPEIKQDLAEGRLEALPMVARSTEREGSFDFTVPYLTMHGTIVVRESNTDIHGPQNLQGKRVAVLQEDIAHEYLRTANLGVTIVPLPSFATALRELSAGKHDAVVLQKLLAFQIMKEANLTNLRVVGPPLTGYRQEFCFAVRKGDGELLSQLNEGLSLVMADGTLRRLHAEWFASLEAVERTKSRIIVGGDVNYPPYEFLDANGQPAGLNVELTRAIARQIGWSVDIQLAPWATVRAGLNRGEIDLAQGMFYSAERDKSYHFSPPHAQVQHVIVVRQGSPVMADMSALAGKSILVMAGDLMHELALQHGYGNQVVVVDGQEEALRQLAAGHHDCALVARVPALYYIEKNGWPNLVISGQPLLSAEYCYAVPRGKESFLSQWAEGLALVKKLGEYRAIQAKWLAPYDDTQPGAGVILKYVLIGAVPLLVLLAGALLWTRSLRAQVNRRTQELQENEQRLKHAQEIAHLGSWELNLTKNKLIWSDEVYCIFGLQPQEFAATYEAFLERVHPEDRAAVDAAYSGSVREGKEAYEIEHRVVRQHTGEIRYVREKCQHARNKDGRILRSLGMVLDITENKHMELALVKAKEAAESANRAKSQFLASMSHELRTPMNAILGMTDLALNQSLPAETRDFLKTAKESADQLLEILNEILDFSRIEAGRFELEYAPFNLPELIEKTVRTLGVRAYEKGLELVYDLDDQLPGQVKGDALRLRQVLTNLVGNAIKFTHHGEIVIRAALERQETEQLHLRFGVSDTGIGIAPEKLEKIFTPFTQADASTTRHYGGSGLGLAISQRLVQMMGGRIWVESELGRSSTFYFTVVLHRSQETPAAKAALNLPVQEALRDQSILVVVHNRAQQRMLQHILSSWTLRPEIVSDVPAALAKIHQAAAAGQHYSLVLAEAVLPNLNGFTLAEWLRKEPKLAGSVILLISGNDRLQYPDQCQELGCLFVDKPIVRSSLFNAITKALGLHPASDTLDTTAAPLQSEKPPCRLRILLAEDTPANQKLVLHVLGGRGHQITVALNGREALKLLAQQTFDVVLMDVQMPEMDGFEATRLIRQLADLTKAQLPVIALTAHALKGDQERCLAAGMTAYLSKPIKAQEMIQLVEQSIPVAAPCESAALQDPFVSTATSSPSASPTLLAALPAPSLPAPPTSSATAPIPPLGFDLKQAVKQCYGQLEMFQDMVECFFQETDELMAKIHEAMEQNHGAEIARLTHRLVNTICYLGCPQVTQELRRLEQLGKKEQIEKAAEQVQVVQEQLRIMKQVLGTYRLDK